MSKVMQQIIDDTCPNPSCGCSIMDNSDVDISDFPSSNTVTLATVCNKCKTEWTEVYELKAVNNIKVEGKERKEHYKKKS